MNFKAYDILSMLIPGFVVLLIGLKLLGIPYDKDLVVGYTAIAFIVGFLINTLSSWLEGFYFFTWGGKPSENMLNGKNIWKLKFYESKKVKELLKLEANNQNASNDQLFSIAMRYSNGKKDSRVDDFNASYAFTRVLLTTILIGTIILLIQNSHELKYYFVLIPSLLIVWLRCKQRSYYYVREVLNEYLNKK